MYLETGCAHHCRAALNARRPKASVSRFTLVEPTSRGRCALQLHVLQSKKARGGTATQLFALLEHSVVDNSTSFILKQPQLMKHAVTVLSSSSRCALTHLSAVSCFCNWWDQRAHSEQSDKVYLNPQDG